MGRADTLSQVWTEKRVVDEMEAKQENWLYWGCWAYDLTWHRYIYKTRLKRALEKLEEAGLQGSETYERVVINLGFIENLG